MKKIFMFVLLFFLFGCGHKASADTKATGAPLASKQSTEVKIGEFTFTKPAGWNLAAEYKCTGYLKPSAYPERNNTQLPCLVREMRSPSRNLRMKVRVKDIGDPKRTVTQLCVAGQYESKNCFKDTQKVVLYSTQTSMHRVYYMVFFSNPHTEIMIEIESSSEMTRRETEIFASFVKSIQPG